MNANFEGLGYEFLPFARLIFLIFTKPVPIIRRFVVIRVYSQFEVQRRGAERLRAAEGF